jgi:spoIIIJ-associated protein
MTPAPNVAEVEAEGETVGEAKWQAVRELERLYPGVDRDRVTFEILAEGERGLLGVGTSPARVLARVDLATAVVEEPAAPSDESPLAEQLRELVEHVAAALGARARVSVTEDDAVLHITASTGAGDAGYLIGRSGRTIDAIQYVTAAVAHQRQGDGGKTVEVDAAGYRERRRARVLAAAKRAAERAVAGGSPVALDPMTSLERKLVHTALQDVDGVETRSEGDEPNRCVVVFPTAVPE